MRFTKTKDSELITHSSNKPYQIYMSRNHSMWLICHNHVLKLKACICAWMPICVRAVNISEALFYLSKGIIYQHILRWPCLVPGPMSQLGKFITNIISSISKSFPAMSHLRIMMPLLAFSFPSTKTDNTPLLISISPKSIHDRSQHGSRQPNGTRLWPLMTISI